ncbi:glycosyltransferase family 39 protein [Mycobacterium sp. M23085]|uniref:glycosyltransferase family 39 protein n=1 Tax=Mycobacterium sp. M23085 TaxID=3378087 RepID=UPI0038781479
MRATSRAQCLPGEAIPNPASADHAQPAQSVSPCQTALDDAEPAETYSAQPSLRAAISRTFDHRFTVRWTNLGFAVLLASTAVLYVWDLGASGWANSFYAAAVQAGMHNWTAFLFGSTDAANSITVDKPPGALWVMGISARIFGLSSWSILVPQALEGVTAVGVLYASVRRTAGPSAGLLAGSVLALTPVAALIFRFNNPDALLVLAGVTAAYATQRALDRGASVWWTVLAGAAVGLGFLAKTLQVALILPALGAAFLVAAGYPLAARIRRLGIATATLMVSGGWYLLLVELWPSSSRPYIGGSQHNSIIELSLGYNGIGRLTGNETGGLGNMDGDVGWARLFGAQMGTHIAWLLPAAAIAIVAGLCITWRTPRTDPTRAALLLWGLWLFVTAGVFSYAGGILHPYYTVALAPALAGGGTIGTVLLWRRRSDLRAAATLASMVAITGALGYELLQQDLSFQHWLTTFLVGGAIACTPSLTVIRQLPKWAGGVVASAALAVALAGPTAYTLATAATPHCGAIPSVGPAVGPNHPLEPGPRLPPVGRSVMGFLVAPQPDPALRATLRVRADAFTWAAAVVGSNSAAGYQLAAEVPVMAIGGFNGTDPTPTLDQFKTYVAQARIHWFIDSYIPKPLSGDVSGRSDEATQIAQWVDGNFLPQNISGVTVYDLFKRQHS